MKRSGNWWIGAAAGLTLGVAGVVAVDQGTESASAQTASGATFQVTPEQLRINQRISQAAVRRSNESLSLLDPIRRLPNQPNRVLGWRSQDIRDAAVTTPKIAPGAVGNDKLANPVYWAVVNADGTLARSNGATASAKVTTDPGAYKVTFGVNISACSYTATVGGSGTATPPVGVATTYRNPDAANNAVTVRTYTDLTADPVTGGADRGFHLTVSC